MEAGRYAAPIHGYGGRGKLCYVKAGRCKVRRGGQGMVSSGAVSFGRVRHGEAVEARCRKSRLVLLRIGWSRRSRRGMERYVAVSRVAVSLGMAVKVRCGRLS